MKNHEMSNEFKRVKEIKKQKRSSNVVEISLMIKQSFSCFRQTY